LHQGYPHGRLGTSAQLTLSGGRSARPDRAPGWLRRHPALGRATWWLGALFGLLHGVFAGTVLVNAILPLVHPLMGTPATAADAAPLLEPPGFMMVNYGRGTVVVSLVAHVAYGAIIGTFLSWSR
jgi:hypothetical protein